MEHLSISNIEYIKIERKSGGTRRAVFFYLQLLSLRDMYRVVLVGFTLCTFSLPLFISFFLLLFFSFCLFRKFSYINTQHLVYLSKLLLILSFKPLLAPRKENKMRDTLT